MEADGPMLGDSGMLRRQGVGRLPGIGPLKEIVQPWLCSHPWLPVCRDSRCSCCNNTPRTLPYLHYHYHYGLKPKAINPRSSLSSSRLVLSGTMSHRHRSNTRLQMRTSPGVPGKLIYEGRQGRTNHQPVLKYSAYQGLENRFPKPFSTVNYRGEKS